jgi:inner membrane protein
MTFTHTALAIATSSLFLSSASPVVLGLSAIASLLPDVDTSKSLPGRLLFPVSRILEKRFAHRSVTHSFMATAIFAVLVLPALYWGHIYWQALILGYFMGWFGDVFTKSGVVAFYPSSARLVIPGNPRLRLSTNSGAELFVLGVILVVAIAAINMNSSGGILRSFNQVLGMPSGAVEIVNNEGHRYLMLAHIQGIRQLTSEPIAADFEVVKSLTQNDLLVKDDKGQLYRAGSSQECNILANQIQVTRGARIEVTNREVYLDSQDVASALGNLPLERTYVSGMLTLEDAEDLRLIGNPQQFASITVQPTQDAAIAHLESASSLEVVQKLGDYFATGTLVVRSIRVQS